MSLRHFPVSWPDEQPRLASGVGDASASATGIAGLPPGAAEHWSDDAHHAQRTPGAYEWWNFEAIDSAGNGIIVTLFDGLAFHPDYLARVARAKRRALVVAPRQDVLPSYYPAAYVGVFQGGQRVTQSLNLYPPGSFEGSAESPELRCGPNRITLRTDGSFGVTVKGYPYEIHRGAPRQCRDQILSATLTFAPTFQGVQLVRPFRPKGPDGGSHTWVLAAPHGRLTGRVQLVSDSVAELDLPIDALGYHDHVYGQSPVGWNLRRCVWGHVVGDNWTAVWQWTVGSPRTSPKADALMLFETSGKPLVIDDPIVRAEQMRTGRWLARYPRRATLHGSDAKGNSVELLLRHDMVADYSPFHLRLDAAATLTVMGKRQYAGAGVTTIMQPQRVRWPLLSDMVLMSIQPIATDDPLWRL